MTATVSSPGQVRPIFLLAAAAFASSAINRVADPLLPLIAEEFDTHVSEAAVVATAYTLAYGICQIVYGPVGDRFGKYTVVTLMTLLSAVGTGLTALASSVPMIGLLRLVTGGSAAAIIPLSLAYIGDNVPDSQRQVALARFLAGTMLGAVAGQAFGGVIGEWVGWRGVFTGLAGLFLVVAALLWTEMRSGRVRERRRNVGLSDLLGSVPGLLKRPHVRLVVGSVMAEGCLFFGSFAFVGAFIREAYGAKFDVIGGILGCFGLGAVIYSLTATWVIGHLGQRGMVLVGGLLTALAFALVAAQPALAVLPLATVICGFGLFLFHNTLQTHATQMAPEARGMALALFAFSFFIGQSVGISLGGRVVSQFGYKPLFVAAAVLLCALCLWFRTRLAAYATAPLAGPAAAGEELAVPPRR